MSNYGVDSENSKIKQLSFERPNEGEINFIVSAHSGFNHSTGFETLNRYFNHEFLNNNALDLKSKGGRGEALLGSLPYKTMALLYGPIKDLELNEDDRGGGGGSYGWCLRHYFRGGLISKFIKDGFWRFDKWACRARLEFELLTELYSLGLPGWCLRHYFRGGLISKFIKDGFWRFDKWACRARLEFELLTELYSLGLPVPRPLIAREQVGTFLVTNDILVERIDNTNNLAELLEQKASMDDALIDEIANTIAKFAFHKVVHTDLNIRNLLINDKGQCFVIDFDKCFIKDGFTKYDLITMLNRLERSFNKEKELCHYLINDKGQCFVIDFDKCFIKDGFTKYDLITMLNRLERSFNKEKELCHYDDLDTQVLCERLKNQALLSFERLGSAK